MAFDTALNQRQLAVLRWISDGCPDGRWTDFTFKTTAAALASRRLVKVSKRGGVWSAAILPAGEHYLTKGQYPVDHWAKRRRGQPMDLDMPMRPAAVAQRPVNPHRDAPAAQPQKQPASRARELVAEVIVAGGEIQRESTEGPRAYALLVAAVNRHHLVPEGKQLTIQSGGRWEISVIRLEDAPRWSTRPAEELVQAEHGRGRQAMNQK